MDQLFLWHTRDNNVTPGLVCALCSVAVPTVKAAQTVNWLHQVQTCARVKCEVAQLLSCNAVLSNTVQCHVMQCYILQYSVTHAKIRCGAAPADAFLADSVDTAPGR